MKEFLKNKGFTLVEVLLAVTIFSLIVLPMVSFFIQAQDYSSRNKNMGLATHIAQNTLIYMEKQDFDRMRVMADADSYDPNPNSSPFPGLNLHHPDSKMEYKDKEYYEYSHDDCTTVPFLEAGSCERIFHPEINGVTYDDHITVGLKIYNDDPSTELNKYLIRVVVKVTSTREKEPDVFLEGVIVDETIR
jgi:prepilin-type N-terminal cleavage/methylation domain-containing protein